MAVICSTLKVHNRHYYFHMNELAKGGQNLFYYYYYYRLAEKCGLRIIPFDQSQLDSMYNVDGQT